MKVLQVAIDNSMLRQEEISGYEQPKNLVNLRGARGCEQDRSDDGSLRL
jgi:hypothetical protein